MPNLKNADVLLQLKITLRWTRPPIWRRVQVPTNSTFGELHEVIVRAMGWNDSHLHEFRVAKKRFSQPLFDLDDANDENVDENLVVLSKVFPRAGSRIDYQYDFGDCWEHEIVCEGRVPRAEAPQIPWCVKGAQNCPPDDIGGVGGFYNYLAIIGDPDHPEHEEMLEWAGPFDPNKFDALRVNSELAAWTATGRPISGESD